MRKLGKRWFVYCQGAPTRQMVTYYRTLDSARTAARSLSKKYGRASVRDEKSERKPEYFAQGVLSSYEVRGSSARKFHRLSRRDVSRTDLKHLSGAALLKLLRQAVKAGDEEKAEMIGKELDRRGGGFKRAERDMADAKWDEFFSKPLRERTTRALQYALMKAFEERRSSYVSAIGNELDRRGERWSL